MGKLHHPQWGVGPAHRPRAAWRRCSPTRRQRSEGVAVRSLRRHLRRLQMHHLQHQQRHQQQPLRPLQQQQSQQQQHHHHHQQKHQLQGPALLQPPRPTTVMQLPHRCGPALLPQPSPAPVLRRRRRRHGPTVLQWPLPAPVLPLPPPRQGPVAHPRQAKRAARSGLPHSHSLLILWWSM